jgi:hypothetical protein
MRATIIPCIGAFAAAMWLVGCCATRHCDNAGKAVAKYQFHPATAKAALSARTGAPEERIDMLVLSGGGSHGAWGAGVLRGWRDNPRNLRPQKFRVVTGVSTGALLATYAFLGEPADDALLQDAYTNVVTSDIYRKKFLLFALFSDSLYSSKPLARRIEKYITLQTVDRVAKEGQEGRRLYVGTVNHDKESLAIWDLTEIAMDKSNPKRLDLYRQVVLASASIPIMVQPVEIDGNLYADGGARAQLFFEKGFFPTLRQMKAEGVPHPDLTIYIIVNGKLGLDPTNCVSDCLLQIAGRTLDMVLDAAEIGDLYQIKYLLDSEHYGHFRLCYIPMELPVTTSDVFDPSMMGALYRAGVKFGQTTDKWTDTIPKLDLSRY